MIEYQKKQEVQIIAVFGLGHVGIVTAICLANNDFDVIGIDKSEEKIQALKKSELYIYEEGLQEIFDKNIDKLKFSTDFNHAKKATEILVCVGTHLDEKLVERNTINHSIWDLFHES